MPAIWIPKRLVETSLISTAAESPKSFIGHCEMEYDSRIFGAAGQILASGCKVVMLTGPSASGKTTTAHKIAEVLCMRGYPSQVISLDNFYKDVEDYPRLPDGTKDYENVTALDIAEIHRCLNNIVETGETDLPVFDFPTERRSKEVEHVSVPGGICIVEGIHALNPLLISTLPKGSVYRIYAGLREEYSYQGHRILPTRDIRLARRMVRDNKFRGHSLEKTLGMWGRVCMGEDQYIKVFKCEADLLLDTSFSYEICVLSPLISSLAGMLPPENPNSETLNDLAGRFGLCLPMNTDVVPPTSMLREFLG